MAQTASDSTIDALLKEGRTFPPSEQFTAQANVRSDALYREAEADPESFWAGQAEKYLTFSRPWDGVAALPPDSNELAQLLLADPSTAVRIAAAQRCADLAALASAWEKESDAAVRPALASAPLTRSCSAAFPQTRSPTA